MNKFVGKDIRGESVAEPQNSVSPTLEDYARVWTKALCVGDYNQACKFELDAYNHCIKPTESLAAWNEWQCRTEAQRSFLSEYYCRAFPSGGQTGNGRAAIVLHNFSGLAHEVQFGRNLKKTLTNLEGRKAIIVYSFGPPTKAKEAAEIYGTREEDIFFLNAGSYVRAAIALDALLEQNQIGTVIYPSIAFFCFWMSLICRHGNQKFFQMKYYPRQIGRISRWAGGDDGLVGDYREVEGELFEKLPLDLPELPEFDLPRQKKHHRGLRIGSISRIEKIQNGLYADTIAGLLARHPEAEYLVTGKPGDESKIPECLVKTNQVRFLGWVEPHKFLTFLDVYIDPWPLGGGEMSFLAQSKGMPYITLQTTDGLVCGPLSTTLHIAKTCADANLLLRFLPESESDFIDAFDYLSESLDNRREVGAAWKRATRAITFERASVWSSFLFE